jgi:hypothetical protein
VGDLELAHKLEEKSLMASAYRTGTGGLRKVRQ